MTITYLMHTKNLIPISKRTYKSQQQTFESKETLFFKMAVFVFQKQVECGRMAFTTMHGMI